MDEPKAPPWYTAEEIGRSLERGTFWFGVGMSEDLAKHLTLAFNKGFSLGWRQAAADLADQVSVLRNALEGFVDEECHCETSTGMCVQCEARIALYGGLCNPCGASHGSKKGSGCLCHCHKATDKPNPDPGSAAIANLAARSKTGLCGDWAVGIGPCVAENPCPVHGAAREKRISEPDAEDGHGNMFCKKHRSHYGVGDRCAHCEAENRVRATAICEACRGPFGSNKDICLTCRRA